MRLAAFSLFLALASVGQAQVFETAPFNTTPFIRQEFNSPRWKEVERFGKNESEILAMGHDRFIAWYCDPARAGKDGRVEAEKVYGLAVGECNAPLLKRLSRPEQKFMEGVISALADAAKSSVVTAVRSFGEDRSWSLTFAESGTAVTETVHALLNPRAKFPASARVRLEEIYAKVDENVRTQSPNDANGSGRLRFVVEYVDKLFKERSAREKAIAQSFGHRMAKFAITQPPEGS